MKTECGRCCLKIQIHLTGFGKLWLVQRIPNCAACHLDAEEGTFEDAAMHIPR